MIGQKKGTKMKKVSLEGGLEPPTLWLTATRSNQLSYSSNCRTSFSYIISYYALLALSSFTICGSIIIERLNQPHKQLHPSTERSTMKGNGTQLAEIHRLPFSLHN